jgi:uncharacterized protein
VAGPLDVPVAELRRRVGTRRPLQQAVEASLVGGFDGVAGTTVPDDADIELDLVVESVLEGVTVTGTVRAPWRAECRRCLDPVTGVAEVAVQELFEAHPTVGETYPLEGDHIDLKPLLRDAVLLGLPLSVVCRDDCAGPDPERFPATVADDEPEVTGEEVPGEEAEAAPPGDPRWAALRDLRFEE